ncbi:DUF5343 domain-containing protein [Rhizobium ruizarguesonis]|uniref:DUF5343 domain-containing protein n=1 Tax=Rhizobium TaxID=379 RepID=UPI000A7F91C1|nr:DUF5343 domain-containing protein [Rhizobium ruizarguesonis]UED31741.1 DUF5343 domain-containing protein [Rhizobium ruizarguesonis]
MADSEEVASRPEPRRRREPAKAVREPSISAAPEAAEASPQVAEAGRRKIRGNIPYTFAPGVLKRVLEKIPNAEKPPVFSTDFLGSVLEAAGGSARPIIPILKTTQMLNQGGIPTELYAQFQTEGGRPAAALQALRNGFAEIFRRNSYAHNATETALTDILVAITGLTKSDRIVKSMLSTFQCFQEYAKGAKPEISHVDTPADHSAPGEDNPRLDGGQGKPLHLVYNINVVLPETTNVEVFNAIFKSLKGNLLN